MPYFDSAYHNKLIIADFRCILLCSAHQNKVTVTDMPYFDSAHQNTLTVTSTPNYMYDSVHQNTLTFTNTPNYDSGSAVAQW